MAHDISDTLSEKVTTMLALFPTFVLESASLLRLHFAEVPEVLPVVEEELAEDR